ncbi:MAG: AAA family ATPase, partial [Peptostreptococcaceae bacterium]
MYNNFRGLINHLENPAILCRENGEILEFNSQMEKIFNFVDANKPSNITDLDHEFSNDDCILNNRKNIKLRDLNIFVDIHPVKSYENEIQYIYLFEKSMITDNVVEDIIEHIDEVVVIFNKDGIIEKMNRLCDEILPFKRKDVLGRNIEK